VRAHQINFYSIFGRQLADQLPTAGQKSFFVIVSPWKIIKYLF
jgi:hypothetical protein